MFIKGLQKTTVLDFPGKLACTIFLFGCNFRCGFCHNPELVFPSDIPDISEEEVLGFLEKRKNVLDGVCFTGGEPLLTLKKEFVKKIKSLGYAIKIDTNGTSSEKLREFIDEKIVDCVAMDIKSSRENYERAAGVKVDMREIENSIKMISSLKEYEFRTTVVPGIHDVEEVKKIKDWLLAITGKTKLKAYYLQQFVARPGKMISNEFDKSISPSKEILNEMMEEVEDFFEKCEVRM